MPEPDAVTASTGMSFTVRPGLYGPSSLRVSWIRVLTSLASTELFGPRFEKLVPSALYPTADGRSWNHLGPLNDCAASFEPTVLPFRLIRLPLAWLEKATWPTSTMST